MLQKDADDSSKISCWNWNPSKLYCDLGLIFMHRFRILVGKTVVWLSVRWARPKRPHKMRRREKSLPYNNSYQRRDRHIYQTQKVASLTFFCCPKKIPFVFSLWWFSIPVFSLLLLLLLCYVLPGFFPRSKLCNRDERRGSLRYPEKRNEKIPCEIKSVPEWKIDNFDRLPDFRFPIQINFLQPWRPVYTRQTFSSSGNNIFAATILIHIFWRWNFLIVVFVHDRTCSQFRHLIKNRFSFPIHLASWEIQINESIF